MFSAATAKGNGGSWVGFKRLQRERERDYSAVLVATHLNARSVLQNSGPERFRKSAWRLTKVALQILYHTAEPCSTSFLGYARL